MPLHLKLPLRIDRFGVSECNEQSTDAEIDTNVFVAVSYRPGYLDAAPAFGAKPPAFRQNGTDLDLLAERVSQFEDRADVTHITRALGFLKDRVQIDATPDGRL